jgi:hypothetical protein
MSYQEQLELTPAGTEAMLLACNSALSHVRIDMRFSYRLQLCNLNFQGMNCLGFTIMTLVEEINACHKKHICGTNGDWFNWRNSTT